MTAHQIAQRVIGNVIATATPGISALYLDKVCREAITDYGATSFLKGWEPGWAKGPCPSSLFVSLNDEIGQGLPTEDKILANGDIVTLETVIVNNTGDVGCCAHSFVIGKTETQADHNLVDCAYEALEFGLKTLERPFKKERRCVQWVADEISENARSNGYVVNRQMCGHGIGKDFQQEPIIYHTQNDYFQNIEKFQEYQKYMEQELIEGMVLVLCPSLTKSDAWGQFKQNGWTLATRDHQKSATAQATIRLTRNGFERL